MATKETFSRGDLAKGLRDLNLSQADFAYLTGNTPQTVSNWLSGRYPVPRWVPLALAGLGAQERPAAAVHNAAPEPRKTAQRSAPQHVPDPSAGYTPTPEEAAAIEHRRQLIEAGRPIPLADWKAAGFSSLASYPDWTADKSDPANIMIVKRV